MMAQTDGVLKNLIKARIETNRVKVTTRKDSTCIICGSNVTFELENLFDTRFGIEDEYEISRCKGCGIEQILPIPSPKDLKDLYETYYNFGGEKGTAYTGFREFFFSSALHRFWLTVDGEISFHNKKGFGRLLDIGCNEGRGLKIYHRNGYDAEGLELNEVATEEARVKGFTVYTEAVEDFQPEQPYDVVVLSNVLEHSIDPKKMLYNVQRILKPAGRVWISCPNSQSWLRQLFGRSWINWHVPFHLFHFSSKTLAQLLQRSGFEVTELKYATPSHWMSQSIVAAVFAKPGRATRELRNPVLVAFLMLLVRALLFPFLWLGNRLDRGDCLVLVAKKRK